LWLGQAVSQLGDAVLEVTLPVWIGLLTGSPGHVAGVAIAETLPALLLGPLAGVLADRWNVRRVLVGGDALRALLVATLVLVPASLIVPAVYAVAFATAVVGLVFSPAKAVAIRTVVAHDEVMRAQALSRATASAALILGPALGGIMLLRFGPVAGLLVDVAIFIAGAAATFQVPIHTNKPHEERATEVGRRFIRDLHAGFSAALRSLELRLALVIQAVVSVAGSVWFAVDIFFVQQALDMPAESVGVLWAASGAGGLGGSLLIVLTARRLSQRRWLVTGLGVKGGALVWYALTTSYGWALPAAFISGVGGALIAVALGGIVMERAPRPALGRVTALVETAGQGASVAALLLVGLLAGAMTPAHLLLLCGLAIGVAGVGVALQGRQTASEE
jgi:MFS family permease